MPRRIERADVSWSPMLMPPEAATVAELVSWVRQMPYGRPRERSVAGMLQDGRGTCSLKHRFLAAELARRYPDTQPTLIHRVYRLTRVDAERRFGADVAGHVPADGLIDVHRYLCATIGGRRIVIDATFPDIESWDGATDMDIACGEGTDIPAGDDPDEDKRRLEARFCDERVREPFIEALGVSPSRPR